MSVFFMKIVACFAMLLDHTGAVLGWTGWNILPGNTTELFRGIGRIAFPVFAFLLVNGWRKTRNRDQYLSRLLLFACISQVPFTLALYTTNLMPMDAAAPMITFNYRGFPEGLIAALVLAACFWWSQRKKQARTMLWLLLTLFIMPLDIQIDGIRILGDALNVFYTLSLGLIIMSGLESILSKRDQPWYRILIIIASLTLGTLLIATKSDYGVPGVILIAALYFGKKRRAYQAAVVCLWGLVLYGFILTNALNALCTCLAAILILAYNGQKGIDIKYPFYWFYPLHLLALGIVNIVLR